MTFGLAEARHRLRRPRPPRAPSFDGRAVSEAGTVPVKRSAAPRGLPQGPACPSRPARGARHQASRGDSPAGARVAVKHRLAARPTPHKGTRLTLLLRYYCVVTPSFPLSAPRTRPLTDFPNWEALLSTPPQGRRRFGNCFSLSNPRRPGIHHRCGTGAPGPGGRAAAAGVPHRARSGRRPPLARQLWTHGYRRCRAPAPDCRRQPRHRRPAGGWGNGAAHDGSTACHRSLLPRSDLREGRRGPLPVLRCNARTRPR